MATSFLLACFALGVLANPPTTDDVGVIGLNEDQDFIILPPQGHQVLIQNFTELSQIKATLAAAPTEGKLYSALDSQINATTSAFQKDLSSLAQRLSLGTQNSSSFALDSIARVEANLTQKISILRQELYQNISLAQAQAQSLYQLKPALAPLAPGNFLFLAGDDFFNKAELYNTTSRTWRPLPDMPHAWTGSCAVVSADKTKILLSGWSRIVTSENQCTDIFDIKSETWYSGGNLSTVRQSAACVSLPDNTVFFVFGAGTVPGYSNSAGIINQYNFTTNTWTVWVASNTTLSRQYHRAVYFNGSVVIIGGTFANSAHFATCLLLNLTTREFSAIASMNQPRGFFAAAVINNKIWVSGGQTASSPLLYSQTVEVYDGNVWTIVGQQPGRRYCTGVNLQNLFVVYGNDGPQNVDVFSPPSIIEPPLFARSNPILVSF